MAPGPSFEDFYTAIHGRAPFPWQERLAERLAETDTWPSEIGVPTGLGKTACLDAAIWWVASQADRDPLERTAPTRIWWVVNRRLLVDSTAEHAERLARTLADPASSGLVSTGSAAVAEVAERLRSLSAIGDADPLDVIRLRGGVASRTAADPSQPTVFLCTLPMYGSRLLFRGYGSSRSLRPIDAAMAGTDSLVLLDEAHLAPHLKSLIPALDECTPGTEAVLGPARSRARLVSLTATGDASTDRFDLSEGDESHPVVRGRLHAAKPVEVRAFEKGDIARLLADAALGLLRNAPQPTSCLIFANTPKTARETFERLRQQTRDSEADLALLTGLNREQEAERIRARILDESAGMAAREEPPARARHFVVVATQTLEVGADIDAEYLVTEACGVRAFTQRLGRLNRLGVHDGARGVYVHLPPSKRRGRGAEPDAWPVYGTEPSEVLRRLRAACAGAEPCIADLAPAKAAEVLGPPGDAPGRAPEVLPGILREWEKTTIPPDGEAPVEPYFSGIAGAEYAVSLIWRAHVPEPGVRLWPRAAEREAVDVPIREVREALRDDEDLRRLGPDGLTVEAALVADLRPGDQLVLASDRGLFDHFGWNPEASGPVADVSLPGRGLPLDAVAIRRLCGVSAGRELAIVLDDGEHEDVDPADRAAAARAILERVRAAPAPPGWEDVEWAAFTESLREDVEEARGEVPRLMVSMPEPEAGRADLSGDLDETSLGEAQVGLDEHGRATGALAGAIARRLGLRDDLAEVVALAGALHDIGKADDRFQRWLDPEGSSRAALAKSDTPRHRWEATRAEAAWPRGGRHEDLSARLVGAWLERRPEWGTRLQRELLIHLVISHHGNGRPLVRPVDDGTPADVHASVRDVPVSAPADLAIADWDQPRRFRRLGDHFGPWGLALLEAVVRRADHAVSGGAAAREDST